jgi:hypothetical protein
MAAGAVSALVAAIALSGRRWLERLVSLLLERGTRQA